MTTKELKKAISYYTAQANVRIAEYREQEARNIEGENKEFIFTSKNINRRISQLAKLAGTKSRVGEIGVGTRGKTKEQLKEQLTAIKGFVQKERITPEGRAFYEKAEQQRYETFKENYGKMSRDEYAKFVETMNNLRNSIDDFKYGDLGQDMAKTYGSLKTDGRMKFGEIAKEVLQSKEAEGKDSKWVNDTIVARIREELKRG